MTDIRIAAGTQANVHDPIRINVDKTAWMDRARCVGKDPEVKNAAEARKFARLCEYCPVRQECLDYGIAIKATSVVFGGRFFNVHGVPNLRWTDHPVDDGDAA